MRKKSLVKTLAVAATSIALFVGGAGVAQATDMSSQTHDQIEEIIGSIDLSDFASGNDILDGGLINGNDTDSGSEDDSSGTGDGGGLLGGLL